MKMSILEREINSAADHPEVFIFGEIPAYVRDPADVPRDANFKSAADLTARHRIIIPVKNKTLIGLTVQILFIPPEHYAATGEKVGPQARAADWIAQSKRAFDGPDPVILISEAERDQLRWQVI